MRRKASRRYLWSFEESLCAFAVLFLLTASPLAAQVPLSLIDENTMVDKISFKFVDHRTFDDSELEDQIWHKEAGLWDKVMKVLPLFSAPEFPFDPIELQKDVVRLRNFYRRNGYLHPSIDYPASQLDTTDNEIHIVFSIQEGPPLIIQDVGFFGPEGQRMADTLSSPLREKWIDFRDRVTLEVGTRYTDFEGIRLQDEVLTWWKNSGFAFARVDREQDVDSVANTVDLRFLIKPGPLAYVSEILIEGHESVDERIIRRELPFKEGDRYSAKRVSAGQQELFELSLFRVVVADIPEQPEDDSITVRYRLQEASLRNLRAQTGYSLDQGPILEGHWTHRNFFGGARQFTITGTFTSGFGAATSAGFTATSQKGISALLRQPYLFSRKLSGTFSPSYLRQEIELQDLRFEESALRTSLIYTIYPFRTVSFQHTIARVTPLGDTRLDFIPEQGSRRIEVYDRNIFSLNGTFGDVDNFLNPNYGLLVRPLVELGGTIIDLKDDVDYFKSQLEVVGYLPLRRRYNFGARLLVGRIWPFGESVRQDDDQVEYRFDRIRFYAGGPNDVRGWPVNFLGPLQATARFDTLGSPIEGSYVLEPVGGLGKIAANVELRTPAPFLGSSWRGAVFVDVGGIVPSDRRETELRLRDITIGDLRVGTGVGLRYETVVGFIRLDLGMKLNPSLEDLATSAKQVWQYQHIDNLGRHLRPRSDVDTSWMNRFRLHFSIGQSF